MCRRRNDPRVSGQVGTVAERSSPDRETAAPRRHAHPLRARRGCVARDHAQVVRERAHLGERPAPVVDGRALREDRRRALVERRHPVRGRVVGAHARRCARAQRAEVGERARRAVPDERVLMRRTRLAGEDDRVVRRLVREAAVLDEVDADEIERAMSPPARRLSSACLLRSPPARARRRATRTSAPTVINAIALTPFPPFEGSG